MNTKNINRGWTFSRNGETAEVTLPHDFMLATPRTPGSPTWADYGYFQPCRGSYSLKIENPGTKTVLVCFDGVMGLAEIFVNNDHVGFHPYGYTAFTVDIGKYLKEGENTLRVEVDATCQPASRWYTGAGIYRGVELLTSGEDRFEPWGLTVRTLGIFEGGAQVEFSAEIISSAHKTAKVAFCVPELGFSMTRSLQLEAGKNHFAAKAVLHGVALWSPDTPAVYTCEAKLVTDGCEDSDSVSFGVRTVACDAERGFLLNGEPIKLYGACNHHDNGVVGTASFRGAEERRVRILKESGFNAIRTSHNPPSSVMLDVCDRMGMLVIDEIFDCWTNGKKPYDYHLWFDRYAKEDTAAMVLRDRNHPSVVMWSTGNEIYASRWGKKEKKVEEFNKLFPKEYSGDLYAGRYLNTWWTYNYYVKGETGKATLDLKYNTCDTLGLSYSMYSSGIITEYSDRLQIYLNNYDSNHTSKLSTDVITVKGATEKPKCTYTVRTKNQKKPTVTQSWSNGVYTLKVTHNGPIDIKISCSGDSKKKLTDYAEPNLTPPAVPAAYKGELQHEGECFDYKNIEKIVSNGYGTGIDGYTGQGYMSFGTKSGASLRDTFKVLEDGNYTMYIRYMTSSNANGLALKVNGSQKTINLSGGSGWKNGKLTVSLKKGENKIELSSGSTLSSKLYIDNIRLIKE